MDGVSPITKNSDNYRGILFRYRNNYIIENMVCILYYWVLFKKMGL